jgi:hypothetical protein
MADALIMEFEGYGLDQYERINRILGIDMRSGEGDWPDGLLLHSASVKGGGFVIYEVWASQADQERFLAERLTQALQAGGIEETPVRVEWLVLTSHHNLEGR